MKIELIKKTPIERSLALDVLPEFFYKEVGIDLKDAPKEIKRALRKQEENELGSVWEPIEWEPKHPDYQPQPRPFDPERTERIRRYSLGLKWEYRKNEYGLWGEYTKPRQYWVALLLLAWKVITSKKLSGQTPQASFVLT